MESWGRDEGGRSGSLVLYLSPVDGAVVLGAPLRVGVLHQGQVSQGGDPLSGGLLPRAPPQQTHRHVGCVVVLKGDLLNLKHGGLRTLTIQMVNPGYGKTSDPNVDMKHYLH